MIQVKLPDGSTAQFPDGTTPDVMKAAIQKKFPPTGQQQSQAPQPAAQPQVDPAAQPQVDPAAQQQAPQQPPQDNTQQINDLMGTQLQSQLGPMLGPLANMVVHTFGGGNVASALNSLGDTASLGLAPAINRGVQNVMSPGSGDATQAAIDQTNQANPAGVVAGTLAAIPVDMALAAPLAAAAPAVPALNALVRGGGTAVNLARLAGVGAVTGGLNAATHGGDVATGATVGAVLGPAGGLVAKPVAALVEKVISPAATKAWRYLANKLGENPDQLVAHIGDYVRRTGQQPSLAQIVSDHDAGVIAHFGEAYPQAGEALRAGAQASEAGLPTAARATVDQARAALPAPPTLIQHLNPATHTEADILNATTERTTAAMNPIRDTPVSFSPSLATDITSSLGTGRAVRAIRERVMNGTATVGDADLIRRRLEKLSNGAIPNPDIQDIADEVRQVTEHQVPQYATIMGQHAAAKRYAAGFSHGVSGQDIGAASDAGLRASLATAEGTAGHRAGSLARTSAQAGGSPSTAAGVMGDISRPGTAQDAFRTAAGPSSAAAEDAAAAIRQGGERARQAAPGALKPQPDTSSSAANLISGIAEAPIAPISAARNISRGLYQGLSMTRLSPDVQRRVAAGLTSTVAAERNHAIRMLRIARVSDARIKLLQGLAAAHTARSATNYQGAGSGN